MTWAARKCHGCGDWIRLDRPHACPADLTPVNPVGSFGSVRGRNYNVYRGKRLRNEQAVEQAVVMADGGATFALEREGAQDLVDALGAVFGAIASRTERARDGS